MTGGTRNVLAPLDDAAGEVNREADARTTLSDSVGPSTRVSLVDWEIHGP